MTRYIALVICSPSHDTTWTGSIGGLHGARLSAGHGKVAVVRSVAVVARVYGAYGKEIL